MRDWQVDFEAAPALHSVIQNYFESVQVSRGEKSFHTMHRQNILNDHRCAQTTCLHFEGFILQYIFCLRLHELAVKSHVEAKILSHVNLAVNTNDQKESKAKKGKISVKQEQKEVQADFPIVPKQKPPKKKKDEVDTAVAAFASLHPQCFLTFELVF